MNNKNIYKAMKEKVKENGGYNMKPSQPISEIVRTEQKDHSEEIAQLKKDIIRLRSKVNRLERDIRDIKKTLSGNRRNGN